MLSTVSTLPAYQLTKIKSKWNIGMQHIKQKVFMSTFKIYIYFAEKSLFEVNNM